MGGIPMMAVKSSTMILAVRLVGVYVCACWRRRVPKLPYEGLGALSIRVLHLSRVDRQSRHRHSPLRAPETEPPKRFVVARGARVRRCKRGPVVTTKAGRAVVKRKTAIGQLRSTVQPGERDLTHFTTWEKGSGKYWHRG